MPHLNDNDNLILDEDITFQEIIVLKSKNKKSQPCMKASQRNFFNFLAPYQLNSSKTHEIL